MFVDLHTHIIPFIDDGAADTEASLKMLRIAEQDGTAHIIATPHYIHGELDNTAAIVQSKCTELTAMAREAEIGVRIYPGNEVFITPEVPDLVVGGQICALNNSAYVLIEFPMMSIPEYASDVFYRLKLKGYTPIIAHPERNGVISADPNVLYDFVCAGALAQVNSSSLTGAYGSKIKEIALTLLRHGMVHFVASDAHTCRTRSPKLQDSWTIVRNVVGKDTAEELFQMNGLAVLYNENIEIEEPYRVRNKKSFLIPFFRKLFTR